MRTTTGRTWKTDAVAVLGILLLAAGIIARTTATPEPVERKVRKQTIQRHEDTGSKTNRTAEAVVAESRIETPKTQATSATAAPSATIEADPDALGAWILALPNPEFAHLEGSDAMTRWVGRIIEFHHQRQVDPNDNEPLESFLAQLNQRIRAGHDLD